MILAMSKIVFQVVSIVFENVIILILYLPTGAGAFYQYFDILFCDRFVRYPTVFVNDFVFFLVIDFKIDIIY